MTLAQTQTWTPRPNATAAISAPEAAGDRFAWRWLGLAYGVVCYAFFLGTFLYAIGFVENQLVPRSIDTSGTTPWGLAVAINVGILGLFGVQHSIMARPQFKARWTRIIPAHMERSTFVLFTCLILSLLFWQWRSIPQVIWQVEHPIARYAITGIAALGWVIVLISTFLIDHFDLFGLRQVILHWQRKSYGHRPFATRGLYRVVRHPIMLGFMIAFWSAPTMTAGHLLFAGVVTMFVLVALQLEERDLANALGDDYRDYQKTTPMLVPFSK